MKLSVIGESVPRVDIVEKVTGRSVFSSDVMVPGMLHAKVLRSPYAHARIKSIDTTKAERLPGVRCIVTGKDAPDARRGFILYDQHVLAKQIVRWAGEPIAAVAADDIDIAEEAVDLIDVQFEELPGLFDIDEALKSNPEVVLHPELFHYQKGRDCPFDLDKPNVFFHHRIRRGDTEKGFREADLVMETEFTTGRIQHAALELHSAVVQPGARGDLTIWTGRQDVASLRNWIGVLFGIGPSRVRIIRPYVGGAFGSKLPIIVEPIAVMLALKTARPVKLSLTREEVFLTGGNRVPMTIQIKDGVTKDGYLLAREMRAVLKAGAYSDVVSIIVRNSSFGAVGTYRVPNFKWDSYGVYVNEPPACNFRGFGSTQVVFAIESHMDMMAEKLGIDAIEFRRKNLLSEGEPNLTGEIMHSTGVRACLDSIAGFAAKKGESQAEGPWKKGRGVALGNKYCAAPTVSVAKVKISEDGLFLVYHGADDVGQGCNTVVAQIAAEEFGVTVNRVKVIFEDTLVTPFFNGGSTSSRVTYQLGNAVRGACRDAKKKLFQLVAEKLNLPAEVLETRGGDIYEKGGKEKKASIVELFAGYKGDRPGGYGNYTGRGEIIGEDTYVQPFTPEDRETGQIDPVSASKGLRLVSFWTYGARAVEVAVNIETGQVRVLRSAAAVDMGPPINPKMCEQQMDGGMGMAIGDALFEEMRLEKGIVLNPNFTDYRVPSASQMPLIRDVESIFCPVSHKDGPYGAKGLGEVTFVGLQAAIANAIYDAVGVRIKSLPITPERLLHALKNKGKQ